MKIKLESIYKYLELNCKLQYINIDTSVDHLLNSSPLWTTNKKQLTILAKCRNCPQWLIETFVMFSRESLIDLIDFKKASSNLKCPEEATGSGNDTLVIH